ncbi:hypothetical protein ZIOFF_070783 [Zingiber officinale]|uniref:Uncharacterized protein n=1 Tax=Zingiber officinale TaxID=94328 RepID=A0A8J5C033_ZINOF|nr:hypothetical protein ZIOFF_070783 [Zingiber officinale]
MCTASVYWANDCFRQGRLDMLVNGDEQAMQDMERVEMFVTCEGIPLMYLRRSIDEAGNAEGNTNARWCLASPSIAGSFFDEDLLSNGTHN